jgi:hypothetical protein
MLPINKVNHISLLMAKLVFLIFLVNIHFMPLIYALEGTGRYLFFKCERRNHHSSLNFSIKSL